MVRKLDLTYSPHELCHCHMNTRSGQDNQEAESPASWLVQEVGTKILAIDTTYR